MASTRNPILALLASAVAASAVLGVAAEARAEGQAPAPVQTRAPAAGQPQASLVDAIRGGDRATALALLAQGADPDAAQPDGTSALLWAVYRVDRELVRELLARGARAERPNDFGASPLTEAVKIADLDLVRALLKAGANADTPNGDGQTPLMIAARVGSLPIVRELVEHGADVNAREKWRGQTALMWAAGNDAPEVVEYLLRHRADANARGVDNDWGNQVTSEPRAQYRPAGGMTPLLYAARAGCLRCVDALLKAGAGIDVPNPEGVTPLMTAIDNSNFELARHLLEKGANPNIMDWYGRTPLYIATDVHSLSPRAGPPGESRTGGLTALDIMRDLLEAGVERNPQLNMHRPGRGGNSGRFTDDLLTIGATPLLRAAVSFDVEAIRLLLDYGADVNLPNGMGATPLMAAAGLGVSVRDPRGYYDDDPETRSIETMKVLLAAGADVNARVTDTTSHTARIARPSTMTSRQGQTALFGAINWGWAKVVKFLLDNGARVDIVDAAGKTVQDALKGNAGGRDHRSSPEIAALIAQAAGGRAPS